MTPGIFMIFWKRQNCKERNQISDHQGLGVGTKEKEETFGEEWKYFLFSRSCAYMTIYIYQNSFKCMPAKDKFSCVLLIPQCNCFKKCQRKIETEKTPNIYRILASFESAKGYK